MQIALIFLRLERTFLMWFRTTERGITLTNVLVPRKHVPVRALVQVSLQDQGQIPARLVGIRVLPKKGSIYSLLWTVPGGGWKGKNRE